MTNPLKIEVTEAMREAALEELEASAESSDGHLLIWQMFDTQESKLAVVSAALTAAFQHPEFVAQLNQWRPIESAPRAREVLVYRADAGVFIAKLVTPEEVISSEEMDREGLEFPDDFEEWWSDAYGWQEGSERPTLWREVPEPPRANLAGLLGDGE